MVRNAVDHGIEEQGEVVVRAWRERDMVLLEVADNGRGIDAHVIRQKAVARGMISPAQARSLRDREALQLVCIPGFSTATEITETSGRGVGMDVVKSAVENLGGGLEILSEPGKGTRMRLKLPLSVAIIQILLVECSGRTIGIPITKVERTLDLPREEIQTSGRKAVIQLGEEMIPLLSLHKILGLPKHPSEGSVSVVITEGRGRRVGLVVDRFCGQREAFVKTLAFPLDSLAGVSGATVIGDGSIIFIIDPQYLLEERTVAPLSRVPGDCR
jgi:two-component system chemotaxis sensor kinase CheA